MSLEIASYVDAKIEQAEELINTLWTLMMGILVFAMLIGLTLLEVGSLRSKNAKTIMIKNMAVVLVSIAAWGTAGWAIAYGSDLIEHPRWNDWLIGSKAFMLFRVAQHDALHADTLAYWFFSACRAVSPRRARSPSPAANRTPRPAPPRTVRPPRRSFSVHI